MNNIHLFTVGENVFVDNANIAFIIEINTSNYWKHWRIQRHWRKIQTCIHYYIIKFNASYIYNKKISLATLNSNTLAIPLPWPQIQPPIQPSATNSLFRRLQNIIKICQTWKFDKGNKSYHPLYICSKQNKSKGEVWIRNEIPKENSKNKTKQNNTQI